MKNIYIILILPFLISCEPEWKSIFKEEKYFNVLVCIPITCENKDSITVCSSLEGFDSFQNMKIMPYLEFCDNLYKYIEKKECIEVDSALYNWLYLNNHVKVDTAMLKLYNEYGIDSLLNKYLDNGILFQDVPAPYNYQINCKYILYLCSLHHIYFGEVMTEEAYVWGLWQKR